MDNAIFGLAVIAGVSLLVYILSYKEKIQSRVRARSYRNKRISNTGVDGFQPSEHKSRLKIPGYYEEATNDKNKKFDEIDLTRMFI